MSAPLTCDKPPSDGCDMNGLRVLSLCPQLASRVQANWSCGSYSQSQHRPSTGRACAVAAQGNSLSVPKSNLWYLSALYWLVAVAAGLSGVNFYINYYRVYCQRKWSANYTLSGLSHCLPACHKSAHRLHHWLTVSTSDCIASDNACTSVCAYSVFVCVCVCVYECVIYKPLALSTIH